MNRVLRAAPLLALLLITIGTIRITATYPLFSQTYDESAHIATGMEWLDLDSYTLEALHPPLSRVAIALLPYLAHRSPAISSYKNKDMWSIGNDILGHVKDGYYHTLTLARIGILPFFVLGSLFVWLWSRKLYGDGAALISLLLFTTLPPILAHAGLATTDMALTAGLTGAFYALHIWSEKPSFGRSILLGLLTAMACLTKLSAPVLLAPAFLITIAEMLMKGDNHDSRPVISRIPIQPIIIAILMFGLLFFFFTDIRTYTLGYVQILNHHSRGSYCLGKSLYQTVWYFFPVALFFKTPLPFLLFLLAGLLFILHDDLPQFTLTASLKLLITIIWILVICMTSRIALGIRHILFIYPIFALIAGHGFIRLWEKRNTLINALLIILLACQIIGTAIVHPYYLSYFNIAAGDHPEHILVDSDLDWGQDVKQLVDRLNTRHITHAMVCVHENAPFTMSTFDVPDTIITACPNKGQKGWVAVGLSPLYMYGNVAWLQSYQPVERIGTSINLYYLGE